MPAAWTVGNNTPIVSTTIEMPSRKHPKIMKNTISTTMSQNCERPMLPIHSASARGKPMYPIDRVRNWAPARINAIMQYKRVAPKMEALNVAQFSDF